jgi:hypothetical protein
VTADIGGAVRNPEDDSMATQDFSELDTFEFSESDSPGGSSPEFVRGVRWGLLKVAAWLEATRFVAGDDSSQRAMDTAKALIAEHARQAAANYRSSEAAVDSRSRSRRSAP